VRIRAAVTRGYGDFWQGASIDWAKLARHLPPLPDTADELKAVAEKLGAAAGDLHLGSDATETAVKRTALADYRVVYLRTVSSPGMSRNLANSRSRSPCPGSRLSLTMASSRRARSRS